MEDFYESVDGISWVPAGLYGYEDSPASPTPHTPLFLMLAYNFLSFRKYGIFKDAEFKNTKGFS
ncbi:MAG: hypothetical protein L2C94_002805 [Aigarchaeota archaeon]|nr:hypothetical protein [Candidatus Wolframiiraptor gerlachensis]